MRSRAIPIATFFVVCIAVALPLVTHAEIPFFGPIIPKEQAICPGSWALVIVVVNNIIKLALTVAITFFAPIMVTYSGFLFITNPANPGGIQKAKDVLTSTIIGILVAFAAWFIVAALMAVFYDSKAVGQTWNSLIVQGGGDLCLKQEGSLYRLNQTNFEISGVNATGRVVYVNGKAGALCPEENKACSISAISGAAQAIGLTLSEDEAAAFSCIATTESSGNPDTPDSETGACGTYQLTRGNWRTSSFHMGACSSATSCNNADCNLQSALLLFNQRGYQPWTGKDPKTGQYWNSNATACVKQYDPNTTRRMI